MGSGLPDCMNKLAKLLTMLFVFHCICLLFSLFFLTALMMVWLNYSRNLATLHGVSPIKLKPPEFVGCFFEVVGHLDSSALFSYRSSLKFELHLKKSQRFSENAFFQ